MPRRFAYGPSVRMTTRDAVLGGEEGPEPTGTTVERGREASTGNHELLAVLDDSASSFYLLGRSDGRCELWHVASSAGSGPGVIYPQEEQDRIERGRGARRPYDSGISWLGEGGPRRERPEAEAAEAERRVELADRNLQRATTDADRARYGLQLGRLTRARDSARLRQVNQANRRKYA